MKIGRKYLYSNGRGNYHPQYQYYKNGKCKDGEPRFSKAKGWKVFRKGLNSKLRHIVKKEIENEILYS